MLADLHYMDTPLKRCSRCREHLPPANFYTDALRRDGLSPRCKPCTRAAKAESNARRKAANPEAWAERRRGYVAAYKARHPERTAAQDRSRNLRRKYGMTPEQYATLLDEQGGGCAVCGAPPPEDGRPLVVDHSHTTGVNRGLLCDRCNLAIGHLRDRADLALAASEYLTKRKA